MLSITNVTNGMAGSQFTHCELEQSKQGSMVLKGVEASILRGAERCSLNEIGSELVSRAEAPTDSCRGDVAKEIHNGRRFREG